MSFILIPEKRFCLCFILHEFHNTWTLFCPPELLFLENYKLSPRRCRFCFFKGIFHVVPNHAFCTHLVMFEASIALAMFGYNLK